MKLLILTNTWLSPSEVFIRNLVDGVVAKDVAVTVLCKKTKGLKQENNLYQVISFVPENIVIRMLQFFTVLPVFIIRKPRAFATLCSHLCAHHDFTVFLTPLAWFSLRKYNYDAIHCQFGYLGNIGMLLKKTGIITGPVITSFRGSDISSYFQRKPQVYNVLKNNGDMFLPVCDAFKDRLVELGFPSNKIHVYHSAINLSLFPFLPMHKENSETQLLAAGRLVEKKGFTYAIDALASLRKRDTSYRLVIAGNGPLDKSLSDYAKSKGLESFVSFTGWINQQSMREIMRSTDVFLATNIQSSSGDTDGIPNIVKEAMAIGIPIVAFRHPGLEELIQDEVSGYLVPERDTEALVSAIEKVITKKDTSKLLSAARKTIEINYSKEGQAQMLVNLLEAF